MSYYADLYCDGKEFDVKAFELRRDKNMDNHSTSLHCEHCGRFDTVELQDTFGIVLCPECREQLKVDIENVVRKYRTQDTDLLEALKKVSSALHGICVHECYDYGYAEELAIAEKVLKGEYGNKGDK